MGILAFENQVKLEDNSHELSLKSEDIGLGMASIYLKYYSRCKLFLGSNCSVVISTY